MGQKTSSHDSHATDDAHHAAGHHGPAETEEQRQDRARALEVELCWARSLKRPGAVLALVLAGVSLGFLGALGRNAPSLTWPWLLVSLLAFAWALALARGGREPEPEPPPAPAAAHH